jgi:hypothetical protein
MGFESRAVALAIECLLGWGLILNYDPTVFDIDRITRVEISPAGRIHLLWGTTDEDYIKAMAQVTPIRDENCFAVLQGYSRNLAANWANALVVFIEYLLADDRYWCEIPNHKIYMGQMKLANRLRRVGEDAKRISDSRQGFTRFSSRYTEPRKPGDVYLGGP